MFRPLWVSRSLSSPVAAGTPGSWADVQLPDERSPSIIPVVEHDAQREQVLRHVSLLSGSIMQLSHKAQAQGLSFGERVSLEEQLAALESCVARVQSLRNDDATQCLSRPSSPPSADDSADVVRNNRPATGQTHPGVILTRTHKKRAKRTFNRACLHCGTQYTSQWRKGPAGASTLCNACGIRYARRLKKEAKAQAEAATMATPVSSDGVSPLRRSNVYALLN